MISNSNSHSLSSSITEQLHKEGESLVSRIKEKYRWLPQNVHAYCSYLSPPASSSVEIDSPGHSEYDISKVHVSSYSGLQNVIYPWNNPLESISTCLADSVVVSRMQAAINALSSSILPHQSHVDNYLMQKSGSSEASTYHLAASYKSIKKELLNDMDKFSQCRDEFLQCLRDDGMRVASLKAMQEMFHRIEEWYCRLEDQVKFCPAVVVPSGNNMSAGTTIVGNNVVNLSSSAGGGNSCHYMALLSPEKERISECLGIRITQWYEDGKHMVKLENIGDNRIRLLQALFSLNETSMPSRETSNNKWIDLMDVERVLTPYRERSRNLGGECEPAFICFAFSPSVDDQEEFNDIPNIGDISGDVDEEGMLTPTKKRRDDDNTSVCSSTDYNENSCDNAITAAPPGDGKRKRLTVEENLQGGKKLNPSISATFKLHVLQ